MNIQKIFATTCIVSVIICPSLIAGSVEAQNGEPLSDRNGDGEVSILALGDSISYGLGDGFPPNIDLEQIPPGSYEPAGYPLRLEGLLSIPVQNGGIPGELLTGGGDLRVPKSLGGTSADIVLLAWGSNDAFFQVSPLKFRRSLQRAVNVIRSLGKLPVIFTPPVACCNRAGLATFTLFYSEQSRRIAEWNGAILIDLEKFWQRRCPKLNQCPLLNRPEGLHPNTLGYDFISLIVSASLYQIDLDLPDGPNRLADALELEVTAIQKILNGE